MNAAQQQQLERLTGGKYVDLVPNATPNVSAVASSKAATVSHSSGIPKRTGNTIAAKRSKTAKKTGKAKKKPFASASMTKTTCIKTHTRTQKNMQEITNMMASASIEERKPAAAVIVDKQRCPSPKPVTQSTDAQSSSDLFKKRRRLAKKLRQIDALKARQQKGEAMSALQLQKLTLESSIRQQLDELPTAC